MLDPRLFRLPGFATGTLSLTVQFFASFGLFFIVLQYLQSVVGFSPLRASLALLPLPLVLIPLARQAPAIADRFGLNRTGAVGLALIAAGMLVISRVGVDLVYWQFAAGLVILATGAALAGTPATATIVASLPPERQGVASAVNDTSRELGSALGIALLGSLLNGRYRAGLDDAALAADLPAGLVGRARESIGLRAIRCRRPARAGWDHAD